MKYISEYPEPDGFIYLLSPYSDPSMIVRTVRYVVTRTAVAYIVTTGFSVYSPIVHNHEVALGHNIDGSSDFWNVLNVPFLKTCSEGWVLMIDGWESSQGIQWEVEYLKTIGKKVQYVYLDEAQIDLLMVEQ